MKPVALLFIAACATSGPVEVVSLPPVPPPGPWLVMHDAIESCGRMQGLIGELRTRVTFDRGGIPLSVASPYGDEFAACVGNAIQRTRYRAQRDRTLLIEVALAP